MKEREREKKAVIWFHKCSEEKLPQSFYHSQLYLFLPWRVKKVLLRGCTFYPESYIHHREIIDHNMLSIFKHEQLIDNAFQQLQSSDQPTDSWDELAPENQQNDYDAEEEGVVSDDEHTILQPGNYSDLQM